MGGYLVYDYSTVHCRCKLCGMVFNMRALEMDRSWGSSLVMGTEEASASQGTKKKWVEG